MVRLIHLAALLAALAPAALAESGACPPHLAVEVGRLVTDDVALACLPRPTRRAVAALAAVVAPHRVETSRQLGVIDASVESLQLVLERVRQAKARGTQVSALVPEAISAVRALEALPSEAAAAALLDTAFLSVLEGKGSLSKCADLAEELLASPSRTVRAAAYHVLADRAAAAARHAAVVRTAAASRAGDERSGAVVLLSECTSVLELVVTRGTEDEASKGPAVSALLEVLSALAAGARMPALDSDRLLAVLSRLRPWLVCACSDESVGSPATAAVAALDLLVPPGPEADLRALFHQDPLERQAAAARLVQRFPSAAAAAPPVDPLGDLLDGGAALEVELAGRNVPSLDAFTSTDVAQLLEMVRNTGLPADVRRPAASQLALLAGSERLLPVVLAAGPALLEDLVAAAVNHSSSDPPLSCAMLDLLGALLTPPTGDVHGMAVVRWLLQPEDMEASVSGAHLPRAPSSARSPGL